jgi:nucleoside-diphosphate-sugar epimerase
LAIVTGAPGWLGTRLVDTLLHGLPEVPSLRQVPPDRKVRCLVHGEGDPTPLQALSPRVEIVRGDLTEPASLVPLFAGARGATLFHAAAVVHPVRGTAEFQRVNVEGTRNLLAEAVRAGVRRVVHVSSNSPIGTNAAADQVFDEQAPYNPYMGYGKSKKLAEDIVLGAHERGEIQAVVIRPPWFYGPGQPPRQALFFRMVRDGKAPIVGGGENRRSMAYVDNICQGALLCERVDAAGGQVYWIADPRPYAMNEIVDTIERVIERDFGEKVARARMRLPGFVSDAAWLVDGALQGLGLYHQKVHVLSEMNKTIACSIAKAERELGYHPHIELEEGMRRSIRWMLDRGERL